MDRGLIEGVDYQTQKELIHIEEIPFDPIIP